LSEINDARAVRPLVADLSDAHQWVGCAAAKALDARKDRRSADLRCVAPRGGDDV